MRQIDDAHNAKNQGQAASHQEQKRAIGNAVEGLNYPEMHIHFFAIRLPSTNLTLGAAGPAKERQKSIKLIAVQKFPAGGAVRI